MKLLYLTFCVALLQGCVATKPPAVVEASGNNITALWPWNDGLKEAFEAFSSAARDGDRKRLASFASGRLSNRRFGLFEEALRPAWRLSKCTLRGAHGHTFAGTDTVVVETIIEGVSGDRTEFVVVWWMKKNGKWVFLNFPFFESGILPIGAFDNESMSDVARNPDS